MLDARSQFSKRDQSDLQALATQLREEVEKRASALRDQHVGEKEVNVAREAMDRGLTDAISGAEKFFAESLARLDDVGVGWESWTDKKGPEKCSSWGDGRSSWGVCGGARRAREAFAGECR
jgi:hypothetical protein